MSCEFAGLTESYQSSYPKHTDFKAYSVNYILGINYGEVSPSNVTPALILVAIGCVVLGLLIIANFVRWIASRARSERNLVLYLDEIEKRNSHASLKSQCNKFISRFRSIALVNISCLDLSLKDLVLYLLIAFANLFSLIVANGINELGYAVNFGYLAIGNTFLTILLAARSSILSELVSILFLSNPYSISSLICCMFLLLSTSVFFSNA